MSQHPKREFSEGCSTMFPGTRPGEWASRAGVELSTTDMAYLLVSGGMSGCDSYHRIEHIGNWISCRGA